jgi:nitrogen fixation NifU-like protein
MSEWNELYMEVILDHNKNPRNKGKIEGYTHSADGHNPLCGDSISIQIVVEDDVVTDASFIGSGCAISTASASILTETIKGLKKIDIEKLFHNLVTSGDSDSGAVGKFSVFGGVRKYPARVKCATLSWHALMAALEGKKEASTE